MRNKCKKRHLIQQIGTFEQVDSWDPRYPKSDEDWICTEQHNYDNEPHCLFDTDPKGDEYQLEHNAGQRTLDLQPRLWPPLSSEITTLILSQLLDDDQGKFTLYECALVNKHFHAFANPLLWQYEIDLNHRGVSYRFLQCLNNAPLERRQQLQDMGRSIRRLRFNKVVFWTDEQLLPLHPHLSHLQHLTVHNPVEAEGYKELLCHCPQLTSIELVSSCCSRELFAALGQHCRRLNFLQWDVNTIESLTWLSLLAPCSLHYVRITSDLCIDDWTTPAIQSAITAIKTLDSLVSLAFLSSSAPPSFLQPLANRQVAAIQPTWPRLQRLALRPCQDLDDATLIPFLKSHPDLRYLILDSAAILTDTSLDAMAVQHLPHLMELTITGNQVISHKALRRLIRNSSTDLKSVRFAPSERAHRGHFPEIEAGRHSLDFYFREINLVRNDESNS